MDSVDLDRRLAKLEWERDFDQRLKVLEHAYTRTGRDDPVFKAALALADSFNRNGYGHLRPYLEELQAAIEKKAEE